MACNVDYGWFGLAGTLALLGSAGAVVLFAWRLHLWSWNAWRDLYFYQVAVLFGLLLAAVVLAKVLATAVQLVVVYCQVRRYRQLIREALMDQERRLDLTERGVRKVLICHASVGAGHKRAAEAIAACIQRVDPSVEIRVVDLMESPIANRTLIYFYKDWYLRLVGGETFFGDLGGHCVGFFFDRVNNVSNSFTGGGTLQRRITQSFLLNFLQLVCDLKPDVVIHTHFLAPELLASLRRRHGLRLPHVTVVTDMDVHAWWYQQPTDHYFAPRELARFQLCSDGVPAGDVTVSGIPIMPQFQDTLEAIRHLDVPARRKRFLSQMDTPLDPSLFDEDVGAGGSKPSRSPRPLVIVMSTGRSIKDIYKHVLQLETPVSVVVVCGRQADVRATLEAVPVPPRHRVALLGFTRTIHELLAVGDVIITKPGGLITSEALACGLMMVVVDPYPGQEERNASMLLEEGAGIWLWDYRDLVPKLDPVLSAAPGDRCCLQRYRENALRLAKPDAALVVTKYVLSGAPRQRMLQDVSFINCASGCSETADSDQESTSSRSATPLRPNFLFCANTSQEEDRPRPLPPRARRMNMGDLEMLEVADANAVPLPLTHESDDEDGDEQRGSSPASGQSPQDSVAASLRVPLQPLQLQSTPPQQLPRRQAAQTFPVGRAA